MHNQSLPIYAEEKLREFHNTFEHPVFVNIGTVPCEIATMRAALIREEASEYTKAPLLTAEELDGLIDTLYVVIGTNITLATQTLHYVSGQRPLKLPKQNILNLVIPMIQDLDCRFPCAKIQFRTSNALIARILDIGAIHGYRMREAFDAVHNANMKKLWSLDDFNRRPGYEFPPKEKGVTAKKKGDKYLVKRADGKTIKPPSFTPPDLTPFLK